MNSSDYLNIASNNISNGDETDPTLYNALFNLKRLYHNAIIVNDNEINQIINFACQFLRDEYGDYIGDNNTYVDINVFIMDWRNSPHDHAYGGNGSYDMHNLSRNCLRDILRMLQ